MTASVISHFHERSRIAGCFKCIGYHQRNGLRVVLNFCTGEWPERRTGRSHVVRVTAIQECCARPVLMRVDLDHTRYRKSAVIVDLLDFSAGDGG